MEGDNRSGWSPRMVFWNTLGTCLGAMLSGVALLVALIALLT